MKIGNQMQNHKIETNSELIYEDGSIWSTLIFIKIIGSYILWFPFPPSEFLGYQLLLLYHLLGLRIDSWQITIREEAQLLFH